MSETQYSLIVAFTDESASFVEGFEAGGIWAEMKSGTVSEISKTTHSAYREVIQRMAVALGWAVDVKPSGVDGWDFTIITKSSKAPETPNPHGLRVVK